MLKIGVAQIVNSTELERNFASIESFLRLFSKENVHVVLFPECSLSGFSAKIKECTIDRLQPFLSSIENWSRQTGIHVVLPTAIFENGEVYNSGFWFGDGVASRFQKLGLTESEKKFFSVSEAHRQKVFSINGYRCALLVCMESQQDPWTHFQANQADIILWPGYWGWTLNDRWNSVSHEGKPNLVYKNMSAWGLPLIQANFAANDLGDSRTTGPEGLSVVVDENNVQRYKGPHLEEAGFVVTLGRNEGRVVLQDCRSIDE